KFDPTALTVSVDDVSLGSIPGLDGWQVCVAIDQARGLIGIEMFGATPLTSSQLGSLVRIRFHSQAGSSARATTVQLADAVWLGGEFYGTTLADEQGAWILGPGSGSVLLTTGT